ncbi:MAG: hypothetical protein Q4D38_08965 [Planctomycetia bacterium]|nr:hypothetical protein [Planctomycetia bacterium]
MKKLTIFVLLACFVVGIATFSGCSATNKKDKGPETVDGFMSNPRPKF